ncbi:hypothetical protein NIES4071_64610 [Calothrix sp. NIES-4071]|nr:hypothetical protein NIES4071_64610 [Calothrix sp. NIES-4071]BAZ60765.1 hypothetical protein NIES4105_64570 [Calothrix sp. NIES-4105]
MNIQRKYSLPNCTLLLEGLSDASKATHFQEMRPELSILVNAECYLSGLKQPLVGGREFFEGLVRVVSGYAQQFLSNVPNPLVQNQDTDIVQLHKIDNNRHKLIVISETVQAFDSINSDVKMPVEIELNTVQLFDLVEAVDQFFADSQTLPELTLALQSSRRSGGASEGVVKQVVPATVGLSSLAAAALAFSLIPTPQPRVVQPTAQKDSSSLTNTTPNVATPVGETATPVVTEAAVVPTPGLTATPTPTIDTLTGTPTPTPTVASTPGTPQDIEALLKTVPEITDPSQLRALNRQVYNQINPAWANRGALNEDVVFRVGVAADGAIIGYKPVNKNSNDAVSQTPLPNLLYNPATRSSATNEPIAQFRVVFRKQGALEVSPWLGYSKTPQVVGEKIKDPNQLKELNTKLYDTIRNSWGGTPTFNTDLKYRVAINQDGVIADYEPLNKGAFDFYRETPLPKIFNEIYGSNVAPPNTKQPLAHYEVIFKPSGQLEIQPWQGYQ